MGIDYLLLVVNAILVGGNTFFAKKYTQVTKLSGQTGSYIFIILSGLFSMLSFWALSEFHLQSDRLTLFFAFISSLIYDASNILNLFAYKKVNLILLNIFAKAVSLGNWLCGITLFGETPTTGNIISLLIIMVAVFLPLVELKHNKSNLLRSYLIGSMQFLLSVLNTTILKLYLQYDASDASSMFFWGSAFMIILPVVLIALRRYAQADLYKTEISFVDIKAIGCIALSCLFGNPSSVLGAIIVERIPIIHSSIISSALNSLIVLLMSKLVFKERISKNTYFAFCLTTIAGIVNAL